MKIDHLIFLLIATVSLVFVAFILTGCKSEDFAVLDQQVGHNPLGQAVIDTPSPVAALVLSSQVVSSSSSAASSASSSSSSSEYVPPPTEWCETGSIGYRLWSCGPDNHRVYI